MSDSPRAVHPGAWWIWALGLATAVSQTTNPVLLLAAAAVATIVVRARRGHGPWGRAYRLYVILGLVILAWRALLHIALGGKVGEHALFPLPAPTMPEWAAGITIGGTVYLEGLLGALVEGLRLAVIILCMGAANAVANPKRLLRSLPGALQEIGTAVIVSVTVAPQLAESVQRVMRARRLRGEPARGLRAVRQVALPVLQDTLDRSLLLASAMDSRGYGRRTPGTTGRLAGALSLAGLLAAAVGLYGLLGKDVPLALQAPTLVAGLLLGAAGIWLGGRGVERSTYRPDPWRAPEWLVSACGLLPAAAVLWSSHAAPADLVQQVLPLAAPALPALPLVAILLAALPAWLTPPLPEPATRRPVRRGPARRGPARRDPARRHAPSAGQALGDRQPQPTGAPGASTRHTPEAVTP
ncbi:MAG: energy-coupling factor transporter transmembrane protein EcfT [Micrococcales bacterium]|nr:energy-coupling factor transporter transmembrane protein EcfT [Micrococcales bacterium]